MILMINGYVSRLFSTGREYKTKLIEKGRLEGKQEGKIQVAKGLKQSGISIEIISRNTGLTPEEIDKL